MKVLIRFIDGSTLILSLIGALGIVAMILHITLDVVLRSALDTSIPATMELVTNYYMITLAILPLAWVEWRKHMIFVEIVGGVFGKSWVRYLDVLVAALSASIYIVLAVATWGKAVEQYEIGSYVMSLDFPMPIWPTYFVLPLAFSLAALVSLTKIAVSFNIKEQKRLY